MRFFCLLNCCAVLCLSTSTFASVLPSGLSGFLGAAYRSKTAKLLNNPCVLGPEMAEDLVYGMSASTKNFEANVGFEMMLGKLDGTLGLSVDFPIINEGSFSYARRASANDFRINWLLSMEVVRKSILFDPHQLQLAKRVEEISPHALEAYCGDEYISQVDLGAQLFASLVIDFATKDDMDIFLRNNIKIEVNFHTADVSLEGDLKLIDEKVRGRTQIHLHLEQQGGDSAKLAKAINRDFVSCTLDSIQSCLNTLRSIIQYMNTDFSSQLKGRADYVPLRFNTQSYKHTSFAKTLVSPESFDLLDETVKSRRKNLQQQYIHQTELYDRANKITLDFSALLDGQKRAQIKAIEKDASHNIQQLHNAIQFCYNNPNIRCIQRSLDLKPIDKQVLDLNARWIEGKSAPGALIRAVEGQDVDQIYVAHRAGSDLHEVDVSGRTALHVAAEKGLISAVKALIGLGASCDLKTYSQKTPIHLAAEHGYGDVITFLAQNSCPLDAVGYDEMTALQRAVLLGHSQAAKALVNAGANLQVVDENANNLLHIAVKTKNEELIKLFLSKGLSPENHNKDGLSAIDVAIQDNSVSVLKVLLTSGGNRNSVALHQAIILNHRPAINLFLSLESELVCSRIDRYGYSALHWAAEFGYLDLVKSLIVDYGVDMNAKSKHGETALDLALLFGHAGVAAYLTTQGAIQTQHEDF